MIGSLVYYRISKAPIKLRNKVKHQFKIKEECKNNYKAPRMINSYDFEKSKNVKGQKVKRISNDRTR